MLVPPAQRFEIPRFDLDAVLKACRCQPDVHGSLSELGRLRGDLRMAALSLHARLPAR